MTILNLISMMEVNVDGRRGVSFQCIEKHLTVYGDDFSHVSSMSDFDSVLQIQMLNGDVWNIKNITIGAAEKTVNFLRMLAEKYDARIDGSLSSQGTIAKKYDNTKQPVIGAQIEIDAEGLLVVLDIEGRLWRQYRDWNGIILWVEVQLPIDERV